MSACLTVVITIALDTQMVITIALEVPTTMSYIELGRKSVAQLSGEIDDTHRWESLKGLDLRLSAR